MLKISPSNCRHGPHLTLSLSGLFKEQQTGRSDVKNPTMTGDAEHLPIAEIDKETNGHSANLRNNSHSEDALGAFEKESNGTISSSPAEQKPDEPPDGGYGWVCVAAAFWINAHTWGMNSVCASEQMRRHCD